MTNSRPEQHQFKDTGATSTNPRSNTDVCTPNSIFRMDLTALEQRVSRLEPTAAFQDHVIHAVGQLDTIVNGFDERLVTIENCYEAHANIENALDAFRQHLERFDALSKAVENQLDMFNRRLDRLETVSGAIEHQQDVSNRRLEHLEAQNDVSPLRTLMATLASQLWQTNQQLEEFEARMVEQNEHSAQMLKATRAAVDLTKAPSSGLIPLGTLPFGTTPLGATHHRTVSLGAAPLGTAPLRTASLGTTSAANSHLMHNGNSAIQPVTNEGANSQIEIPQPLDPVPSDSRHPTGDEGGITLKQLMPLQELTLEIFQQSTPSEPPGVVHPQPRPTTTDHSPSLQLHQGVTNGHENQAQQTQPAQPMTYSQALRGSGVADVHPGQAQPAQRTQASGQT